jgi:hypothetical protein
MKKQKRANLSKYLFDKLTGTFTGFVVAIWATGIVSHFFETRSIKNLWGLTSRKTIVDKQTFGMLEWLASAIVGYIVFEIVIRVIKNQVGPRMMILRFRLFRWVVRNEWHSKFRSLSHK